MGGTWKNNQAGQRGPTPGVGTQIRRCCSERGSNTLSEKPPCQRFSPCGVCTLVCTTEEPGGVRRSTCRYMRAWPWRCGRIAFTTIMQWVCTGSLIRTGQKGEEGQLHFSPAKGRWWSNEITWHTRRGWASWDCSPWRRWGSAGILTMCINTQGSRRRKRWALLWCPVTGQYQGAQIQKNKIPPEHKKALLHWVWSHSGPGRPERLWSLHPWQYWRPHWTWYWSTCWEVT